MNETLIKTRIEGKVGVITLNRPEALNALTHSMIQTLQKQLHLFAKNPLISCVFVHGEGRAFCAGGDIRLLYQNGIHRTEPSVQFFKDEYALTHFIYHYPKPYITYLDGITLGGGVGISLHGSHRIATPRFSWGMPEVNIGFFPDVGVRYHLARLPHALGLYLALSGKSILAHDALACGLATHYADSSQTESLIEKLARASSVDAALNSINPPTLQVDQALLACYQHDSLLGIYTALTKTAPTLAQELASRSLFSVQTILGSYEKAKIQTFDTVIKEDLRIAKRFLQHPDFYEGIRAALIDKDQCPQWKPTIPSRKTRPH